MDDFFMFYDICVSDNWPLFKNVWYDVQPIACNN